MVNFRTNIDCAKRFMGNISGLPLSLINPNVGDRIRVYHDSQNEIWMKVSERKWTMTNGSSPVLECCLDVPFGNISQFEQRLRSMGFSSC